MLRKFAKVVDKCLHYGYNIYIIFYPTALLSCCEKFPFRGIIVLVGGKAERRALAFRAFHWKCPANLLSAVQTALGSFAKDSAFARDSQDAVRERAAFNL